MATLIIVLGAAVLIGVFIWGLYNSLVTAAARVRESWAQIDVQLKKRADLIPSLAATVREHLGEEQKIYEELTTARTNMASAQGPKAAGEANQALSGVLGRLFALAEDNPELRTAESFQDMRSKDTDIEDKIAYARQFYNTNVMEYNIKLRIFPNNVFSGMFGFKAEEFFEAAPEEREKPNVSELIHPQG